MGELAKLNRIYHFWPFRSECAILKKTQNIPYIQWSANEHLRVIAEIGAKANYKVLFGEKISMRCIIHSRRRRQPIQPFNAPLKSSPSSLPQLKRTQGAKIENSVCIKTVKFHAHCESFGTALGEPTVKCAREESVGNGAFARAITFLWNTAGMMMLTAPPFILPY
ncbi:uncharacterized protein EDB91DRAFT_1338113 [Suillus paluster]|uniref:uncharacterized protein n=1 Tax=Suillus paluster TaxID=48578 RepID=UPI001B885848|nr:uncharacterized protein EDB91DRAFT_1338113 [Suillus paluster]KAG1733355.1 hypothetical protein EDB91DRAFT_1338113 [Suillus paluster]